MITFSTTGHLHRHTTVDVSPSTRHDGWAHVFIGGLSLYGPLDDLHALATELLNQLTELVDDQAVRPVRAVLDPDGPLRLANNAGRPLGLLDVGNSSGFKPGHRLLIERLGDGWTFIRWVRDGDTAQPDAGDLAVVTVTEAEADGE